MISLLRGEIAEKSLGHVVLDVGGVGYGVAVPLCTYYKLPGVGEGVELKIYTSVREDAITLYGFLTEDERRLFNLLIVVSGFLRSMGRGSSTSRAERSRRGPRFQCKRDCRAYSRVFAA